MLTENFSFWASIVAIFTAASVDHFYNKSKEREILVLPGLSLHLPHGLWGKGSLFHTAFEEGEEPDS